MILKKNLTLLNLNLKRCSIPDKTLENLENIINKYRLWNLNISYGILRLSMES